MKHFATVFLILGCSLVLCSDECLADLTVTNIDRSVFATVTICDTTSNMANNTTMGVFMDDVAVDDTDAAGNCQGVASANAFQHTTVTTNSIFGDGSSAASYDSGFGFANGNSFLQVDFNSSTAFTYELNGTLDGSGGSIFENFPGNALVQLLQSSTTLHSVMQSASLVPVVFDFDGTLGPGNYSLIVSADSSASNNDFMNSDYDFMFNIAPVPEPSSAGIAMLCLSMVGMRRRRRRG